MEHESFEDIEVAKILNDDFISIKVDREERPDIDSIYMSVCQSLTGSGGWPLTIFITPDQEPFFAGTYFPKNKNLHGIGLIEILEYINNSWKNNRNEILKTSQSILNTIDSSNRNSSIEFSDDILDRTFIKLEENFDPHYGGFGISPKFPTPQNLLFLLRYWKNTKDDYALKIVEKTLESMYRGGIYDHIGYGFSRYSTDEKWLVPHFEKMLYDNALIAIAYLETFQVSGKKIYSEIAEQILTYILRDMTSSNGGFYSAEDADSEGIEGKFYIWSKDEIKDILGEKDGNKFCFYFNITSHGNFDGKNIPNLIGTDISTEDREIIKNYIKKLFNYRNKRVHPHKDDKILSSWNGLMITAMAMAGKILKNRKYTEAAERALDFIYKNLIGKDGRLLARYRDGEASFPGYIDDYAFLTWGLIELYETTYGSKYLKRAVDLTEDSFKLFWDEKHGGFFLYGNDSEKLISRPKKIYDGALPSGNSVFALNLMRLSHLTGNYKLDDRAQKLLKNFSKEIGSYPTAYCFSMIALLFSKTSTRQIVIVPGNNSVETEEVLNIINEQFSPFNVSILYSNSDKDLKNICSFIGNYQSINGKPTVYICENFSCKSPIIDTLQLKKLFN